MNILPIRVIYVGHTKFGAFDRFVLNAKCCKSVTYENATVACNVIFIANSRSRIKCNKCFCGLNVSCFCLLAHSAYPFGESFLRDDRPWEQRSSTRSCRASRLTPISPSLTYFPKSHSHFTAAGRRTGPKLLLLAADWCKGNCLYQPEW